MEGKNNKWVREGEDNADTRTVGIRLGWNNETKIWEKHKVSTLECEQLFLNRVLLKPDEEHSLTERRYAALGETDSGRKLFVAFTIRDNGIRVISARNMTRKEKIQYEQTKKEDPKIQE